MKGRKCGTVENTGGVAGASSKFMADGKGASRERKRESPLHETSGEKDSTTEIARGR